MEVAGLSLSLESFDFVSFLESLVSLESLDFVASFPLFLGGMVEG